MSRREYCTHVRGTSGGHVDDDLTMVQSGIDKVMKQVRDDSIGIASIFLYFIDLFFHIVETGGAVSG